MNGKKRYKEKEKIYERIFMSFLLSDMVALCPYGYNSDLLTYHNIKWVLWKMKKKKIIIISRKTLFLLYTYLMFIIILYLFLHIILA